MEEPPGLAARPHHGRFPIPFVTHVRVDGRPDFRVHDNAKRAICGERRLCQLCGQPLGPSMLFAGFDHSVETGIFGEPPMHADCLEWAWAVCPFLAGAGWRHGDWAADAGITVVPPACAAGPPKMAIYETNDYTLVPDDEGSGSIKWRVGMPIGPIEWRRRDGR